jgi:hypothetical protein
MTTAGCSPVFRGLLNERDLPNIKCIDFKDVVVLLICAQFCVALRNDLMALGLHKHIKRSANSLNSAN